MNTHRLFLLLPSGVLITLVFLLPSISSSVVLNESLVLEETSTPSSLDYLPLIAKDYVLPTPSNTPTPTSTSTRTPTATPTNTPTVTPTHPATPCGTPSIVLDYVPPY